MKRMKTDIVTARRENSESDISYNCFTNDPKLRDAFARLKRKVSGR